MPSDFTGEVVSRLIEAVEPVTFQADGLLYTRSGNLILPPQPKPVDLHSLAGVVEFVDRSSLPEGVMVLVRSPIHVDVVTSGFDKYGRRTHFASAKVPEFGFPLGTKIGQERFVVEVCRHFLSTPDRAELLEATSKIKTEATATTTDDGVTQSVAASAGVTLVQRARVNPFWKLTGWMTFREIEQPVAEYLLRIDADGRKVELALHSLAGNEWEFAARRAIKDYLETALTGIGVHLPVIQ